MSDEANTEFDASFDASGLMCPEPIMMLHGKVRDLAEGDVLQVIATDPATERDIPKFCQFLGHSLVRSEIVDKKYYYYIEKKCK